MIDDLLDELFDELFMGPNGPLISSRMALEPEPGAASYLIAAPRSRISAEDMALIDRHGAIAALSSILDDLPADQRQSVLGKIRAICDALAEEQRGAENAEPPSLIYALH